MKCNVLEINLNNNEITESVVDGGLWLGGRGLGVKLLTDRIVHIHASDNNGDEDQHLGIGKGKIDYNWFSETLNKIGYDKSVIIESITDVPQSIQKLQQLLA